MNIFEMLANKLDIFDKDFDESDLTDLEQDRAIESMLEAGYTIGMLKTRERVYWAPENATL